MTDFLEEKKKSVLLIDGEERTKEEIEEKIEKVSNIATNLSVNTSVKVATDQAAKRFAKPDTYKNNRILYDDGAAKNRVKKEAFSKDKPVKSAYTGKELELKHADAKLKYGNKWQEHAAEADHIVPLERVFETNKNNPWLTNQDIKKIANDKANFEVIDRKTNNAKRSRTNKEFVKDKEYLAKENIKLTEKRKDAAIKRQEASERFIKKEVRKATVKNAAKTGHKAGKAAAEDAGIAAATVNSIMNIVAVIKGEKNAKEALVDTGVGTGKAATKSYVQGGSLTVLEHTLSSNSSKFIKALGENNVPTKVITIVSNVGHTVKRYCNGEISTEECIIALGEDGAAFVAGNYGMIVGEFLIPIPVVGAAVGSLVGSVLAGRYYNELVNTLETKKLEHEERLRIIAECETAVEELKRYRLELEGYLKEYFKEYQDCFDEALNEIKLSLQMGDVDGVIGGANQITRKLGGTVQFDTVDEFEEFLFSDTVDRF